MRRGRLIVGVLVFFLLAVVVGSVVTIVSIVQDNRPQLAGGDLLVLDIRGPLPEQPMPEELIPALGRKFLSVTEIDAALQRAATDDKVQQILVRPAGLAVGFAKVQEIRDALHRFSSDSGKPVTCWMEATSNKEYYLATACDEIYMAPEGFFLVNGMHLTVTFYKGTLDKLGVEAEFARAGKYKSAIEPLTSTKMSEPFREMLEAMVDELYGDFVEAISVGRGLDEATVRQIIDDPPLTAAGAARAGLIDGLLYEDQLLKHLSGRSVTPRSPAIADRSWLVAEPAHTPDTDRPPELPRPESGTDLGDETGEDAEDGAPTDEEADVADRAGEPAGEDEGTATPSQEGDTELAEDGAEEAGPEDDDPELPLIKKISLANYLKKGSKRVSSRLPRIAIVYCEGAIISGPSSPGGGLGGVQMGSDTIAAAIKDVREDDHVAAVVLRIDSPGGSGLASDIIWREVELTRALKPVVVSMSDYAASGGYYIAMGADAIVAQPGTLTGSIGVFAGKYNLAGLYDKVGLKTEAVKRGEFSDIFAPDHSLGEAGRTKLTEFIDEFYAGFITKAAQGRGVEPSVIHSVAQGRVWTGSQAHQLGLVDELGSIRTAIAIAKEKAGVEGPVGLVHHPKQPTFLEQLLGAGPEAKILAPFLDSGTVLSSLPPAALRRQAQQVLTHLPFFSDGKPVLMSPYHMHIQ